MTKPRGRIALFFAMLFFPVFLVLELPGATWEAMFTRKPKEAEESDNVVGYRK